jgi:hypothetical protein
MLAGIVNWVKTWNLTTCLAVWGAVIATANVIWSIRRELLDTVKIRVSARLRCIGFRDGDGKPYMADPGLNIAGMGDRLYVVVSVTNVGRRPMRWKGWGGKYKMPVNGKDGFLVSARFLPHTLGEQEGLDEWTDLDRQFVDGNVKRLYVWDVADNEWDVPQSDLEKLAADITRYADVPQ